MISFFLGKALLFHDLLSLFIMEGLLHNYDLSLIPCESDRSLWLL